MAYIRIYDAASTNISFAGVWRYPRSIIMAHLKRRRAALTQAALAELTPEQLKDIGLEAPPRPSMIVSAGLMTKLMSMR